MTSMNGANSTNAMTVNGIRHRYLAATVTLGDDYGRWPVVLRLLAENVGRCAGGNDREHMLAALRAWPETRTSRDEIHFAPSRILMHDTTSTPALVDMAAMRDELASSGIDPAVVSPTLPVEVAVDHSLAVESYATPHATSRNLREEIRRNRERYRFLRWASDNMDNIHINPPGTGIMHTINLEQLATVVTTEERDGELWVVPDQMVGTDSHTPMINGLGVLGWGVGGLEAETVMFGMPTTLRIPDVVGVHLSGELGPGTTSTDLALVVTHRLRDLGVAGEFVEFHGPGVSTLSVGDRAVVANMAPEYGATTGYFPVDAAVLDYLRMTGRDDVHVALVERYCRAAGLWFDPDAEPSYSRTLSIDLSAVAPSAAGPRRPQDLLPVSGIPDALMSEPGAGAPDAPDMPHAMPEFPVALASITSCTNTTDPRLIITAGLVGRRAREFGLTPPPWVKTSLAPGSPAAASYLRRGGLLDDLSSVGFDIVGFGCTTCIGNSGGLPDGITRARDAGRIVPGAVLSGNRNFPGRINPDLSIGFLVSPAMVVAFALAGDLRRDLTAEPVQILADGREIHLADLWPGPDEVDRAVADAVDPADFAADFRAASRNEMWEQLEVPDSLRFPWDPASTILRPPPFARSDGVPSPPVLDGVTGAHPLLVLGDDVTTDHISPASAIPRAGAVADFLVEHGEDRNDLNVFASRRGNWEVMGRGAFAARAVRNSLLPGAGEQDAPSAYTVHGPSGDRMRLWDGARRYRDEQLPVIVVAGERYGMGSSRDWAAKAQALLGVRAVLAASFERIHRSNLVGMGILPVETSGELTTVLGALAPGDTVDVLPARGLGPRGPVEIMVHHGAGADHYVATAAVETGMEIDLLRSGGVIPTILNAATRAQHGP